MNQEITALKKDLLIMWEFIELKLQKSREAVLHSDEDLAYKLLHREKEISTYKTKISRSREHIFVVYSPYGPDLQLLLAIMKISDSLGGINDTINDIARSVIDSSVMLRKQVLEGTQLLYMFDHALHILADIRTAFKEEKPALLRTVFKRNDMIDRVNTSVNTVASMLILENSSLIKETLLAVTVIRGIHHIGTQSKNIASEIIFHSEAKMRRTVSLRAEC